MPIAKRGQSYQVTVNNAKIEPKRWRRQFSTEIEARAWEAESRLKLSRGELPDMGESKTSSDYRPVTLRELANYMIDHHWRGQKSEKTSTININTMVAVVGPDTKIREITSHTINVALGILRDKFNYPDNTINKKLSPLRLALKYALKEDWIDRLPHIPFFKVGEGRIRWFTAEEEKAQLDWCRSVMFDDLWDYIVVSYDTGMRQGEVLEAKPRNLSAPGKITLWGQKTDLDRGTKAGTTRTIPLTPRAREVLERRAADLKPHELLFPLTKDQLRGMWDRMRDDLGYSDDPEYVAHCMRHTFCTRLVKAKVNLAVIQKLAGHLRIETTLKYVHVDDDVMVEAIDELAAFSKKPAGSNVIPLERRAE